ncbi:SERTA domain-containing protein 1 [Phascolarctos cinereus]|uniref:SERTA domain-containing protein 1 n=1 Tax=Phascolarctos cinereus TaxID=38626 RepID=A0A6P5JUS7_PHACI|nr:SERTA domain-containing protein 1 [Phascolarctos cinereus]XP_020834764.1 SERTA domain-containing protein 1 [Phascolarctos cinereus]
MLCKGVKRKREEEEEEELTSQDWWLEEATPSPSSEEGAGPAPLPPSSLFNLSIFKLHHGLRRGEPDLRHLVLVVNTLRRIQSSMALEPSAPEPPCPAPADPFPVVPDTPLCTSVSALLDDLSHIEGLSDTQTAFPEDAPLSRPPDPGLDPGRPAPLGSLELLLEDGLEGLFDDIDTSMYDCELWPNLKTDSGETEDKIQGPGLDVSELDYLMDVIVGTQTL